MRWAVNACLCPLYSCEGMAVVTVEGLGTRRGGLHPVQAALAHAHGSQCGYCTPGFVMSMYALLRSKAGGLAQNRGVTQKRGVTHNRGVNMEVTQNTGLTQNRGVNRGPSQNTELTHNNQHPLGRRLEHNLPHVKRSYKTSGLWCVFSYI